MADAMAGWRCINKRILDHSTGLPRVACRRNVPSLHEQKLQFEGWVIYDYTGTSAGRLRPGEDSCIRGKGGVDCVDIIDVKGVTKRCL